MADDRWAIVEDATGIVDGFSQGEPPVLDGLTGYPAPEGVRIGWVRTVDGRWVDPDAPRPPSAAELVAFVKAKRAEIVDTRLIPVVAADGVEYPLPIEIQTRTALTAGRVQVGIKPDYKIRSWTFVDGRVKVLEGPDIITFSDAADAAFQHVFDQQALCLAGIADGSITTTAAIDALLRG